MSMKKSKIFIPACLVAAFAVTSFKAISQERKLPDGTIIYKDGTRKLPNGTVIYKGKPVERKEDKVMLPDGSVVLPDGSRTYPDNRRYKRKKDEKSLPPGQAKKVYGGEAKDYAPGQQKRLNKKNKDWKDDNDDKGKHKHRSKGKGNSR